MTRAARATVTVHEISPTDESAVARIAPTTVARRTPAATAARAVAGIGDDRTVAAVASAKETTAEGRGIGATGHRGHQKEAVHSG